MRVFCDANILFSAAVGGPPLKLLLDIGAGGLIELVSNNHCIEEARTNLDAKRPESAGALDDVLAHLTVVITKTTLPSWAKDLVPAKDVPVLASALAASAQVLLTGDKRHFGDLMERDDLPLKVRTLRTFLLEGPGGGDQAVTSEQ